MGRPGFGRPKSREETPKEGYDRRSLADVALQNLVCAAKELNCDFCKPAITGADSGAAVGAGLEPAQSRSRGWRT